MCGITGIYAFNMVGRVCMINVTKATEALSSRGPDFQNGYNDETVALGHRRLSIIDTSYGGHQPMMDNTERYVIVFNGEIYNYLALRDDLIKSGVTFNSGTDTEVLLNLFIRDGKDCLKKLNGFFAFAIYDKHEKKLFIARDRLGIKPLYYMLDNDRLVFGSEMKSVMEYGIDKTIDHTALFTYLQLNYLPSERSIFKSVKKLLPGHYIQLSASEIEIEKYFEVSYSSEKLDLSSYEDQKKKLAGLMEDAVKSRLVSDVSLGSFLSGGLDSSIIATLAKRHKEDLHTFSIGYKEEKFFDETNYARAVAKKIGSEHTVFSLTNQDLFDHVHDILNYIDEPFADSSAIAVYILSKETRKHATVALSGDGADELFAGYNKHAAFLKIIEGGSAANLVKGLGPIWKLLPKSRNNSLTNKFRQLDRFSQGMKLSSKERYWRWAGYAGEHEARDLLASPIREALDMDDYHQLKNSILSKIPEKEDINNLLITDVNLVLPDDMLTKVDRMSMANSLEVRVPFLDHKVVEFAFQLSQSSKINSGIRKRILQDTFKDLLPEELYNRPKKGFEVPLLKWLRKDMKSMIVNDLLEDGFIQEQGIFNVSAIQKLKKKLFSSNPEDVHARIWGLVVFQWWWKRHVKD